MRRFQRPRGFTLVELSMTLVIIALLIGGMTLGGSFLIESTRLSNLVSQIKDLSAATREFKTRYGYYPGDLPNAATYLMADGGVSAGCSYAAGSAGSGPGNGLVDTSTESTCSIEHLVKARLLSKAEMNGGVYVIPHPFGNGNVSLSAISSAAERANVIRVTRVPCNIALQIDSKLDNVTSSPLTGGFVRGQDASNATINTCVPGGTNDPVANLLIQY